MKIIKLGRVFNPRRLSADSKNDSHHYISKDAYMRVPLNYIKPFEILIVDKSFRSSYQ